MGIPLSSKGGFKYAGKVQCHRHDLYNLPSEGTKKRIQPDRRARVQCQSVKKQHGSDLRRQKCKQRADYCRCRKGGLWCIPTAGQGKIGCTVDAQMIFPCFEVAPADNAAAWQSKIGETRQKIFQSVHFFLQIYGCIPKRT